MAWVVLVESEFLASTHFQGHEVALFFLLLLQSQLISNLSLSNPTLFSSSEESELERDWPMTSRFTGVKQQKGLHTTSFPNHTLDITLTIGISLMLQPNSG